MFLQTCTCVVTSKDSITRLAAVNRKMTTVINVTVHLSKEFQVGGRA